jgi:hypothetical protein
MGDEPELEPDGLGDEAGRWIKWTRRLSRSSTRNGLETGMDSSGVRWRRIWI